MNLNKELLAIFEEIIRERNRQDRIHSYPKGFPIDLRMEILVEEVGEVAKAKMEEDFLAMRQELIHVAATAIRWVQVLEVEETHRGEKNDS